MCIDGRVHYKSRGRHARRSNLALALSFRLVSHGYKLFQLAGLKGPRECFSPSPLRVYPGVSIMSIYASVKSYQRRSKDLSAVSQGNGMVSDHGTLRNEL